VVLDTQDVLVTEEHHPLVTIVHLVVDKVLTDVSNMTVPQVVTQTKVQLESMVVHHRVIETHQG